MRGVCRVWLRCCAAVPFVLSPLAATPLPAHYDVSILGPVVGGNSSVTDLNIHGVASGHYFVAGFYYACRFDAGVLTPIPDLSPAWHSYGEGINDAGVIVGHDDDGSYHYSGGVTTHIGALGYYKVYFAAVNNSGQVAAVATINPDPGRLAVVYDIGTAAVTELPFAALDYATAEDISDTGYIVGETHLAGFLGAAGYVYRDGDPTVYLPLHDGGTTRPFGVNNLGQAAGQVSWLEELPDFSEVGHQQAWLYDGTTTHYLPIPTEDGAAALAINDQGLAVGSYGAPDQPFVWNGTDWHDLNDLIDPLSGWDLRRAGAINNAGQIAGMGWLDGEYRPFLLTPRSTAVPEPATGWLLVAALAALRRRPRGER